MKFLVRSLFVALIGLMIAGTSFASSDATCLVYQAIDMRSEGTVIKLPEEGFFILAVPYVGGFTVSEKPYAAIARPHQMLSMRENQDNWDSNLISRTGIQIRSNCTFEGKELKEELVTVDLTKYESDDDEPSQELVVEAALECIRRTATDVHQEWPRPVLKIVCKPADEAVWKVWTEAFNKHDFSKPFKRPQNLRSD